MYNGLCWYFPTLHVDLTMYNIGHALDSIKMQSSSGITQQAYNI
jgi:hypothetical protein